MANNFYSSPADDNDDEIPQTPELQRRAKIRRVANRQRNILILFAVNLLLVLFATLAVLNMVVLDDAFERTAAMSFVVIVCLLNLGLSWLLGRDLHSVPVAGLISLLSVAPPLSIVGLTWLSISANRYLAGEGIRVGMMGADPGQIQ